MDISKSIRVGLAMSRKRQNWLADELKVTKAYVSAMCNDKVGVSTDRLQQLADLFDVPVSEFIKWGE